jgi:hypothetical protein
MELEKMTLLAFKNAILLNINKQVQNNFKIIN